MGMREEIAKARRAQQGNAQRHNVQLEIPLRPVTAVCSDGMHDLCSGRCAIDPSAGWHELSYTACQCECHNSPECVIVEPWEGRPTSEEIHDLTNQPGISLADQLEIHGPGPDCHGED
jgi:hypothetical protein